MQRPFRRQATGERASAMAAKCAQLREHALACEGEGQIRRAIEAWTELSRLQEDAAVESHLVELRCDARNFETPATPAEPWPRPFVDPFPDVIGEPPEIDAEQLSTDLLGGAILHHGCLLVRGFMQPDRVEKLRATIDRAFDGRQQSVQGAPSDETAPWYVPCAPWNAAAGLAVAERIRAFNEGCRAGHVVDSPRALAQVVDALESSHATRVVSDYLGEPAVLSVQKTMLRRVPPDASPRWHQDGSFMGLDTRAVDVWVALTECGEGTNAPGLAILPKRLNSTPSGRMSGRQSGLESVLTYRDIEKVGEGLSPVRPRCAAGDALMFDGFLLHGNGGGKPGLTRDRYALEAWMFARSSMPDDYLPLVV
jgi:ectoine hydroxylase-related dioxygenase (phytanoyl-CoA dioxygenase family)